MGIFESIQRSQEHINSIAGVLNNYFQQKRNAEIRDKIRGQFSTPGTLPQGAIDEQGFSGPAAERVQPTREFTGIESPDDAFRFADMMKMSPEETMKLATQIQERNLPQYDVLNQEAGGVQLVTKRRKQEPTVKQLISPTFPPHETKRVTDQKVGEFIGGDGNQYTKFQRADNTTYYDPPIPAGVTVRDPEAGQSRAQVRKDARTAENELIEATNQVEAIEQQYGGPEELKKLLQSSVRGIDVDRLKESGYIRNEALVNALSQTVGQQGIVARTYVEALGKKAAAQEKVDNSRGVKRDKPGSREDRPTGKKIKVELLNDMPGADGKTYKKGLMGMIDESEYDPKIMRKIQ